MMTKFEYLVVQVHFGSWYASDGGTGETKYFDQTRPQVHPAEMLNKFGDAGWNLTGVASGADGGHTYKLFLKRELA